MATLQSGAFLSPKVEAVYNRMLLNRAVDTLMFDKFGMAKSIPAKSNTKKGFAYRYKNMLPATTPIVEYDGSNIKSSNKIVRESVEYEVKHYGDYIEITDELDLYDYDNIKTSFTNILADQAALTVDTITRDALRGGTNVIYANGATTRLELVDGNKLAVIADLKLAALKLKNQRGVKFRSVIVGSSKIGTTPIRSAYVGITSPEVVEDLRLLVGWKNVEDYAGGQTISEDEVGSYGDFRFVENTNNGPVVQVGTDTEDHNVFLTLLMAKDAYATISLRGKGSIQAIVKPIGSAGADDPLDQYGTFGWKVIHGAAIINENWLIRLETTASSEDSSVKHYYDFT